MKMKHLTKLKTAKQLAYFIAQRSDEDRIAQVAGSLTFTTVLSLVPLLTVMFALFTAFPLFASFEQALHDFLAERLMPAQISSQIFEYLNQFAAQAKRLTAVGLIGLGLTAIMTMMTIESAFNVIWRVRHSRPLGARVLVYWAILTLGPLLLGASLSISSWLLGQSMSSLSAHTVSPLVKWALTSATLPLSALAFTMLYVYVPNHRVRWRDALIGGVFAALAFEFSKRGFGLYIRKFPTYTAVYGAFATVPIFLLWVYLSWFITLFGAMLVAALPVFRSGQRAQPRFAGSDLYHALGLFAQLNAARTADQLGCETDELACALRCDIKTVAALLRRLKTRAWVAPLRADSAHWVLLADLQQLTLSSLFDLLVIDRAELKQRISHDAPSIDGLKLNAALQNDKLNAPLTQFFVTP